MWLLSEISDQSTRASTGLHWSRGPHLCGGIAPTQRGTHSGFRIHQALRHGVEASVHVGVLLGRRLQSVCDVAGLGQREGLFLGHLTQLGVVHCKIQFSAHQHYVDVQTCVHRISIDSLLNQLVSGPWFRHDVIAVV